MRFQPRFGVLAAAAALGMMPAAAFAETLSVTGIEITGEAGFRLSVPVLEATDASLDEAALRALFSPDFATVARDLAGLDAASIRIPTLTITVDAPDGANRTQTTTITYHDFELTSVTDGVAETSSVGKMVMTAGGPGVFTMGRMTTGRLDLGGILGLYGIAGDRDQDAGMKPLYVDFALEGMTFASDSFNCEIGPAAAERFSARPIGISFEEMIAVSAELEAAETSGNPPSPEAIARFVEFYVDFLTAMDSTPMTVDGMSCEGSDPDGKKIALSSGPLTVGGFKPGLYPSFGVDDFEMRVVDDGWLQFGNFTWKDMDLNGPIAAVLEAKDALSEAWFEANWRKIIPAIEGFSLADFSMDIPDPENAGERLQAQIAWLDVSLADYVNGIPSRISAVGKGIEVPLPPDTPELPLSALGIDKLLVDYDVAAYWDEASRTIAVDSFALSSSDLGRFTVSATLANAGSDLFSENPDVATLAATGITVTRLTLELENGGLTPLLIAVAAADEGMPPEALHAAFTGVVRALPLATLGSTPEALSLSNALGSFLQGAPKLTLTLTAKDPAGIGLADLMAAEDDPAVLKEKVTIVADVSGDPIPFSFPELPPKAAPAPQEQTEAPASEEAPGSREEAKRGAKN